MCKGPIKRQGNGIRTELKLVLQAVDAAKSVGHGAAAAGNALTGQGDKAEHQAGRSAHRAGDAATELGHAIYDPHKP